jgi:hypothetical protein
MKKKVDETDDELRPEYPPELFRDMKPNRFAGKDLHYKRGVILDADVAEVFDSSESVNTVLRSAIRAMRTAGVKTAKTPAKRRAS